MPQHKARQVDDARQGAVGNLGVESVFRRGDFFVDNWRLLKNYDLSKSQEPLSYSGQDRSSSYMA